MEYSDIDEVKPLDELMDDTIGKFESGRDRECDKDLDTLIWELGDYENEEPPQEAEEFMDETPIEDELVEKKMIVGRNGLAFFKEVRESEESSFAEEQFASASSIGSETWRGKAKVARSRASGKKKK
jgi:hypothetical protein